MHFYQHHQLLIKNDKKSEYKQNSKSKWSFVAWLLINYDQTLINSSILCMCNRSLVCSQTFYPQGELQQQKHLQCSFTGPLK